MLDAKTSSYQARQPAFNLKLLDRRKDRVMRHSPTYHSTLLGEMPLNYIHSFPHRCDSISLNFS